jgi:hypothetical protein
LAVREVKLSGQPMQRTHWAYTCQGTLSGWTMSPIIVAILSEQDWHRPSPAARGLFHAFVFRMSMIGAVASAMRFLGHRVIAPFSISIFPNACLCDRD